jgi:hypothetical protein
MLTLIASYTDSLRKREEFAISLRKQKTKEIINQKRRKILEDVEKNDKISRTYIKTDQFYHGNPQFQKDPKQFDDIIRQVAPVFFECTLAVSSNHRLLSV